MQLGGGFLLERHISCCDVNLGTVNKTDTIGWIGLFPKNGAEAVATTCPLDSILMIELINLQSPNRICNGGHEGVLCSRCPAGQNMVFGSLVL